MKMKRLTLLIFALVVVLSACKTKKSVTTTDDKPPKVYTAEETQEKADTEEADAEITGSVENRPITTRSENFSFEREEDKSQNEQNAYFVIIGSFSEKANAEKFVSQVTGEGFRPIILKSETGYYRVCADSFEQETDARMRVLRIRTFFPQYSDTWLLIKN